jgi:signal transduction histidine kinase
MSVYKKFLIVFVGLAFVPMLLVGTSVYYIAKDSFEKEIIKKLEGIADLKAAKIETYFNERRDNAITMQGSLAIRESLPVLSKFANDRTNQAYMKARAGVDERFSAFKDVYGYVDIMLTDPDGLIVYNDSETHGVFDVGKPVSEGLRAVFEKGRKDVVVSFVYDDPAKAERFLVAVFAPIFDQRGVFAGELVFEMDMDTVNNLILDNAGLQETGETVIGKKAGDDVMLINPTRHAPYVSLGKIIKRADIAGEPIFMATHGESGSGYAVDYRGARVVAVWRHIPSLNWGLSVKMDVSEAFAPIAAMRNVAVIFLIAMIIIGGFVIYMIARAVSRPIVRLTQTARDITAGDLSARAASGPSGEIGELGRYFNEMTDRLTEANLSLERRAGELEALNARLTEDILRRETAEDAVRLLNAQLEQRVTDRTAQLEAANRELEAFSYSVSHDLRAPLRSITGFSELLKKKAYDVVDEKGRHYLDVVSEAALQMGRLIDDILSFSRMSRTEMMESTVNLVTIVKEVIKAIEDNIDDRNISWRIDALPEVKGDVAMLRLALMNLISNAVKFTKDREEAVITIGTMEHEGEAVCYVKDNGVGFDAKYADRLFNLFQRLHRADEFPGTGVGLANVRRIIERHGGRTWANGAPGKGATFYFSLPKAPPASPKEEWRA